MAAAPTSPRVTPRWPTPFSRADRERCRGTCFPGPCAGGPDAIHRGDVMSRHQGDPT
jgi:hypothetical protein